MTENLKRVYFAGNFALTFYVIGAAFVQSFVNYPTWHLIGANEFKEYHNGMSPLIQMVMVLPWLVSIVFTVSLFWLRPHAVPAWLVGVALVFNLVILASTALIQIPIQLQLSESGMSQPAIDKLIGTDPIRWASGIVVGLAYLQMMYRVVRPLDTARQ